MARPKVKSVPARLHVKTGDTVMVISGRSKDDIRNTKEDQSQTGDRGKVGKVTRVFPKTGKIIVEGVNIVHKHQKATQKNPQPAIIKREAPINITNVALVCPKTSKQTRIGMEIVKDPTTGKEKRMRLSKKSGEIIIS